MCFKIDLKLWLLCSLILLNSSNVFSYSYASSTDISEPGKVSERNNDLVFIQKLITEAKQIQKEQNNPQKADSILRYVINIAEMTYNNKLMAIAYNGYLECMDQGPFEKNRLKYALKAEQTLKTVDSDTINWQTCNNISEVYLYSYSYDKAIDFSYKSMNYADAFGNRILKAKSHLSIGRCLEGRNNLIEAFSNYLQALNIAESLDDNKFLGQCYEVLSRFFLLSKNYTKAIEYKLKQSDILQRSNPVDSTALMTVNFELESINFNSTKSLNEYNIERLLRFSDKPDRSGIRYLTLTIYRIYLINTNQVSKLKYLYLKRYPHEFKELSVVEPSAYYRVIALIKENDGQLDSASYYFNKADTLIQESPNKVLRSNFYIRYGQFLLRQSKIEEAILMFKKALQLANESSYIEYAITASAELDNAFLKLNDFQNAHYYARLEMEFKDSLVNISKKEDVLNMEIINTSRMREEAIKREQIAKERRYNLQYTAITIILSLIFLLLIVLGSFKVPDWSIHLISFVSFIMLFEFIVLLADRWIHHLTEGEPWKVLAIKIVLIGILMPVHHWTERKVTHYLIHKKVITMNWRSIKKFLHEVFAREENTAVDN